MTTTTKIQTLQIRMIREGEWHLPYHTLEHWSEYLIPRRYPDNLSPFDIQLLTLRTHGISALLILIRGGCREADVGCDALNVCLLKTKVEPKRRDRNVLMGRPGRLVVFVVRVNLTDVRSCHVFACWRGGSEVEKGEGAE